MIILCFLKSKVTLNKILSLYSRNFVKWKMSKSYMEIRWQHLHKDFTKCCIAKLRENKTSHTHSFVKCHISWRKIKNCWTNYFRKIVKGFDETWGWIDCKKQKQKNAGNHTFEHRRVQGVPGGCCWVASWPAAVAVAAVWPAVEAAVAVVPCCSTHKAEGSAAVAAAGDSDPPAPFRHYNSYNQTQQHSAGSPTSPAGSTWQDWDDEEQRGEE